MFIHNSKELTKVYKCNKALGKYILKHFKIPVLSIHDKYYVFSETEEFLQALKKIPFIIKLIYGGVKHE